MRSPHIALLPENIDGYDYVMGDIHGASTLFRGVTTLLRRRDRLFVAGDLFDRGENSLDIFHALIEMKRRKRQVYVVRGNHEDLFLKTHDFLRKKNLSVCDGVICFFRNGGAWIFKDPELQRIANNIGETGDESVLEQLTNEVSDNPGVLVDEFNRIAAYLRTLPFIILVGKFSSTEEKRRAFFVCHADMPISEAEVYVRLFENNDPFLSTQEQRYVMWARESGGNMLVRSDLRTTDSVISYVGHSIYAEEINSVRHLTNAINLDGGAYRYGVSVVVNHTKNTVLFFGASDCRAVQSHHAKRCNELLDFYFERRIKQYATWPLILENEFAEIKAFLLRQHEYYLFSQSNAGIFSFLFFRKKTIGPALLSAIQKLVTALKDATTKEGIENIITASAGEIGKILGINSSDRLVNAHVVTASDAERDLLLAYHKIFDLCSRGNSHVRLPVRRVRRPD